MSKQEEIKAAMDTVYRFTNPERTGFVTGFPVPKPTVKQATTAAFLLAEAYIAMHDDTPITLDDAEEILANSDTELSQIDGVVYVDFFRDGNHFLNVPVKTKGQLLALLKGLGE